jgi:dipeptidyl aminopeptidase/acylaminoacyl peptidase
MHEYRSISFESSSNYLRWILCHNLIRAEVWFSKKVYPSFTSGISAPFIICCYGCPSHPFDHAPFSLQSFLDAGYALVFFDYMGTFGSSGVCDFTNSLQSVEIVLDLLQQESGTELRHGLHVEWNTKALHIMGASFGGTISLLALGKIAELKSAISVSPVIDFALHGKDESISEENLEVTCNAIERGFKNLWRCKENSYQLLRDGEALPSVCHYLPTIKDKNVMIVHAKNDPAVASNKSLDFYAKLKGGQGSHLYLSLESSEHILLYDIGCESIASQILSWMEDVR